MDRAAAFLALFVDCIVKLLGGTADLAFAVVTVVNLTCRTTIRSSKARARGRFRARARGGLRDI